MRSGELRDRIIVQKRTDTRDNLGDVVPAWTEYADRRCKVTTQSTREGFTNRQEAQAFTHTVGLRLLRGVRTKWRALWRRGEFAVLTAGLSTDGTSLYVDDADEFPHDAPYFARLGDEIVKVTSGMGTTTWTVSRGEGGSTARAHGAGSVVHLLVVLDIEGVAHEGMDTFLNCNEGEAGRGV